MREEGGRRGENMREKGEERQYKEKEDDKRGRHVSSNGHRL